MLWLQLVFQRDAEQLNKTGPDGFSQGKHSLGNSGGFLRKCWA